jgi:DNA primase
MSQQKLRYSEFWDRINVDAFEEAIGFEPTDERNGNDVGFCIWPENHSNGDTTGKFGIHREKRVYNCYVCGGGSLLSLVMELYDFDVDEATEWLYQFCEEDRRSDNEFVDEFLASFEDTQKRIATLPYFNERVLEQWDEPVPAWWLDERGISPETVKEFNLRFNSAMRRPAPQKGRFSEADDYTGPAIVLPHYWKGRLVGWQCRWLDDDRPEWVPKYTMTTDFPKESTVYGYDQAMPAPCPVVVLESVPSALFAHSCGHPSVATFGSNVNDAQLRLLRRFGPGVILAHDNDNAGIKWRDSLTEYLKRYIPVWHLPPVSGEPGADIGDIASSEEFFGDALWEYLGLAYQPGIDL